MADEEERNDKSKGNGEKGKAMVRTGKPSHPMFFSCPFLFPCVSLLPAYSASTLPSADNYHPHPISTFFPPSSPRTCHVSVFIKLCPCIIFLVFLLLKNRAHFLSSSCMDKSTSLCHDIIGLKNQSSLHT